jgi:hypothetical protein
MAKSLRWAGFVLFAVTLAGCSGGGLETVEGVVTLDGAPLPKAHVALVPSDPAATNKGPFVGDTDDQGRFSIGPIGDAGGGIPVGAYRIMISTAYTTDGSETAVAPPERVPQPYPAGVDFEVPAGGTTDANFDLKSK